MTALRLHPRWLIGDLDDPGEAATFAEIAVSVDDEPLAQIEDPDTGGLSEGTRIPALPLALGLTQRWWRLLYEPEKRSDRRIEARHRLDVLTPGYVFPPLALWSGGDGVVARLLTPDLRFQRQRFILPERNEPWYLPRTPVEEGLAAFIGATLERLPAAGADELRDAWDRVRTSMADPDEMAWCMAAGRLGFDPYDAATPNLENLAGSLSPALFADLSEAATVEELPAALDWIEANRSAVARAPQISLDALGYFPQTDPDDHPAHQGYSAAVSLRAALGRQHPTDVLHELIGDAECEATVGPRAVQGIAHRLNGSMCAVVQANYPAQRRFRLCHAIFVAWDSGSGEDRLVSPAKTRRHQAGRAFAAELLAPTEILKERTGGQRPTSAQVERWAEDFGTTPHVVKEQLWNRLHLTPRMAA